MTHTTLLVAYGGLLALSAYATRARRRAWRPAVRSMAEWVWITALTLGLVELGATVAGLGLPPVGGADQEPPSSDRTGAVTRSNEPGAPPVVAFIGDSFTEGEGVADDETLPVQVHDRLAARDVTIDARNFGTRGDPFTAEVERYLAISPTLDPDAVVWVFVLNDFGLRPIAQSDDFIVNRYVIDRTGIRALDALVHARQDRLLTAQTEAEYHAALRADAPWWPAATDVLTRLVADETAAGGRFVFVIYPLLHRLADYPFEDEHRRLEAWATGAGAEVIDLLPLFRGLDETALWVSPRNHHPNGRAHGMAAARIAEVLASRPLTRLGSPRAAVSESQRLDSIHENAVLLDRLIISNGARTSPARVE